MHHHPTPIGDDFVWPQDESTIGIFAKTCSTSQLNPKNTTTPQSHPAIHTHCASRRSPFPDAVGLVIMVRHLCHVMLSRLENGFPPYFCACTAVATPSRQNNSTHIIHHHHHESRRRRRPRYEELSLIP